MKTFVGLQILLLYYCFPRKRTSLLTLKVIMTVIVPLKFPDEMEFS